MLRSEVFLRFAEGERERIWVWVVWLLREDIGFEWMGMWCLVFERAFCFVLLYPPFFELLLDGMGFLVSSVRLSMSLLELSWYIDSERGRCLVCGFTVSNKSVGLLRY